MQQSSVIDFFHFFLQACFLPPTLSFLPWEGDPCELHNQYTQDLRVGFVGLGLLDPS